MRTIVRTSLARRFLVAGALGAGAIAWGPLGCSAADSNGSAPGTASNPGSDETTGKVGMQLALPAGEQLSTVTWKITGPNGAPNVLQSNTVDVSSSPSVAFLVGGIPAGQTFLVTITGTTTDGTVMCAGSATFTTTARTTTNVSVALQCTAATPDAGSALINANAYNCGSVVSLSASPAEVIVGHPIALQGSAKAPNPAAITYTWSSSSGTFDNANAENPSFTCTTAGTATVTLVVNDGAVPAGATCNTALNTSTIQVTCDADPVATDIQNIVVIYAENRSFDSLLGNYPGAHGLNDVLDAAGNPTAAYVPQKDRDGVTVLAKLPQTWGGATAAGNPTVVTQAQTDNLANAPFALETGFVANGGARLTTLDVTRDLAHRFFENEMEINGGTNDMFAAWLDSGGITMGHFDYSASQMYHVAQQYVVADNFFQGAYGGSFLNHQYLVCGCAPAVSADFVATNHPSLNVLGSPNTKGVPQLATNASSPASALSGPPSLQTGNIAPLDYFGTGDGYRAVNTMQPPFQPSGVAPAAGATDLRYANPAAPSTLPAQTQTTIGDLLTSKGVGWAWYAGAWTAATADGQQASTAARTVIYTPLAPRGNPDFQAHHHPFNYYANFDPATHAADRAAHLKDYNDLVADAAAGTLPPVAFYKPTGVYNQHPGYANLDDGDAHIASVISALKASSQWGHMVILVTYDEYGGQWDHVAPPKGDKLGPGSRIPAIVISPYARAAGAVDHTQYDTASALRLITRRFGLPVLPGLAARDAALVANGGQPMGDLTGALSLP